MEMLDYGEVLTRLQSVLEATTHERFSEKIGIGRKTLSRMIAGKPISERSLMAVFIGVFGPKWSDVLVKLVETYPDNKTFSALLEYYKSLKVSETFDETTLPYWEESDTAFRVMNLLCYEKGVALGTIERHWGAFGLDVISRLEQAGKIEEVASERYRAKNWRFVGYSGVVGKSFAESTIKGYKPSTFGTKESALYHTFGRVSESGFAKAKDLVMRFGTEMAKLEDEFPGAISFSMAAVMIKIIDNENSDLN